MTLSQMGIPVMENIVTTRPETEFCNKLRNELGADINPASIVYERIQRIDTKYCRRGEKSGWYVAYDHNDAGKIFIAGDWHLDKDHLVTFHTDGDGSYSDEERKAIWKKAMEEADRRRSEEQAGAIRGMRLFYGNLLGFQPGEKHPYLELKKIGLVSNHKWPVKKNGNYLYIPLFCIDGEIVSCQAIWIDENDKPQKRFYIGCPVKGGFYVIGVDHWEDAVWLCEGYATGVSIYEATGQGVVIAFSAKNLKAVGKAFQDKFGRRLVIVADNDESGAGEKAAMESGLRYVLIPELGMDANDYATAKGVEALRGFLDEDRPRLIDTDSDEYNRPTPVRWLIKRWIPRKSLVFLVAPSGTGKTFLAVDMVCHIAYGLPSWNGYIVHEGVVVYLAGEDAEGVKLKICGWKYAHGINPKEQSRKMFVFDQDFHLDQKEGMALLEDVIEWERLRPDIICVDTLICFNGGEENSSKEAGIFISNMKKIQKRYECTVLIITHTPNDEPTRIRGSSAWNGASDLTMLVTKNDNGIQVSQTKNKKGKLLTNELEFDLVQVALPEVWKDEDGEKSDTACIAPVEKVASEPKEDDLVELWALLKCEKLQRDTKGIYVTKPDWKQYIKERLGEEKKKSFFRNEENRPFYRLVTAGKIRDEDGKIYVTDSEWLEKYEGQKK